MHRARLDDRGARRDQPAEATARVVPGRLPRRRPAGAHALHGAQRGVDAGQVDARVEGQQTRLVEVGADTDVGPGPAVHEHSGVDALPALDAGHDAQQRVLVDVAVAHRSPSVLMRSRMVAAGSISGRA
ncbi:hypothetical protein AUW26_03330 [Streptomyces sp. CC71]|nr:hypothetical protein AUW26_03330 [Streptomyces sp. CC71]